MSGPAELSIAAGILVDAGVKATVLLGLGWGAARLARRGSAAQRHVIWAATFAALPLLPVVAWLRGPAVALDRPWLLAVWAVGSLVAALPLARALRVLRSLRRTAAAGSEPGVLHSESVDSPMTWGLFRPVILFPTAAAGWSRPHREAALAHERAHVARRDWFVHIAVWTVCVLFWFHPAVWWARRALAREAEHAADDLVLSQGVRASLYAELLLAHVRPGPVGAALAVAQSPVAARVHAVLGCRSRSPRRWPTWVAALGLACLLLPALGGWPLWSVPEEALTCQPGLLP